MTYQQNPDEVAAGAPEWRLPATQPRASSGGIRGFVWTVWPAMNWVLPVLFVVHGFFGAGGWGTLILLVTSPVFVPAMGLLGALPRFILRKRGHTTAPGPLVWLLFVNWWGWFTLTITMQDAGDSGPPSSVLRAMMTVPLSRDFELILFFGAVTAAVLAWLAVLLIAIFVSPRPPRAPGASRRDAWTTVSWIAAFAVPALLVVSVLVGVQATAQQRDGAGDTLAEIAAMPLADQVQRAEENYTLTQERLSAVRELISDDGWRIRNEDGAWVGATGFGSSTFACITADVECYTIEVGFQLANAPEGFDEESAEFRDRLEALGWHPTTRDSQWIDAQGFMLDLWSMASDGSLTVEVNSPEWWGDESDLRGELPELVDPDADRTYRYDEWPPLR
jgi:hypothetical protein